jgi:mono/diheme cytochrome c family protein
MYETRKACSMRCVITWLVIVALIFLAVCAAYFGLGAYDIAADVPHWALTSKLISAVRDASTERHSSDVSVPAGLDQHQRIADGAGLYHEMCTGCHLAPGIHDSELRRGLYPQPPDLPADGIDNPGEAFWIIKHGIKLTAMPAWGKSHTDEQIWSMVAFLQQIKGMSVTDYRALVAAAAPEDDEHQH